MSLWQAIILAIVEGLTEFLPISSTGHMIIVSHYLGIADDDFVKLYEVCIQFGAILSVPFLYKDRLLQSLDIYLKLAAAFIPTAILGFLLDDFIDDLLSKIEVVATSLFLGGIILIGIDRFLRNRSKTISQLSTGKASIIGFFQAISMVPGVSRSAATIIGGQVVGLTRQQAAEFSFLLAIPTMTAASGLKLLKNYDLLLTASSSDWLALAVGNLVAFGVAILAIKFFIGILTKYGFFAFGIYRIIVGAVLLYLISQGSTIQAG